MQLFNGKIKSEIESVISTFLPLSKQTEKEFVMTAISIPNNQTNPKICSIEGCSGTGRIRKTYCDKHYSRFLRKGFTDLSDKSPIPNFTEYVKKGKSEDDCWQWLHTLTSNGYGRLVVKGKEYSAHRYSFFLANGYLPKNFVLHSCDNKLCVNPKHLRESDISLKVETITENKVKQLGQMLFMIQMLKAKTRNLQRLRQS